MRAKKRHFQLREFCCPVCCEIILIPKSSGRMTGIGHMKTMWCWKCRTIRDFIQIGKVTI